MTEPLAVVVVTLFPEVISAVVGCGITGRAVERGLLSVECVSPRDFVRDRHRTVDDRPYGGGPGMVMMAAPLTAAVAAARERVGDAARVLYLSPQGRRLDQAAVERFAARGDLVLVCGRYEGVDERFIEAEVDEEVSIGDYVLGGGELPALVLIEAMTRLLPGALGHEDSAREDSFATGLLDCPHYTRPEEIAGRRVPAVLLGGDHGAIARWRRKQALGRTWRRRPELIERAALDADSRALLDEYRAEAERAGDGEDEDNG